MQILCNTLLSQSHLKNIFFWKILKELKAPFFLLVVFGSYSYALFLSVSFCFYGCYSSFGLFKVVFVFYLQTFRICGVYSLHMWMPRNHPYGMPHITHVVMKTHVCCLQAIVSANERTMPVYEFNKFLYRYTHTHTYIHM